MKDNNKRNIMEFWTRKRIPYVFDETLSLYQLVRLTVKYLNEVIKDQNELKDAIKEFIEMFDGDVYNNVQKVIAEMVESGEFDDIIANHFLGSNKIVVGTGSDKNTLYIEPSIPNSITNMEDTLKSSDVLRVATYNFLGTNYYGYPEKPPMPLNDALVLGYRNMLKTQAQIIGIQERNLSKTHKLTEKMGFFIYNHEVIFRDEQKLAWDSVYLGNTIKSTIQPITSSKYTYKNQHTNEKKGFIRGVYKWKGSDIAVYNTHISVNNNEINELQIKELFEIAKNETIKNVIVMGDLNNEIKNTEIELIIKNSGFKNCNPDHHITFPYKTIDYIFIKNMGYKNTMIINDRDKDASDHYILSTEVIINE